ncbi:MAG: hypothetical protein KAI66_22785 [Lentisphaeria bacterium]|nr:hypothetical protein [Lentisphaeria bacterium]
MIIRMGTPFFAVLMAPALLFGALCSAQVTTEQASASATSEAAVREDAAIRLNFRGAPLDAVLDHLSKAAGFVIVKEGTLDGTVDVLSHKPLTAAEAVDLLNTVLTPHGLVAIQTDRILKIVPRDKAKSHDLPVHSGADPEAIPKGENMVTQIVPVRHADAVKLLENLEPLLSSYSSISANQSSNAVIITDTQTNIRRLVSVIQALDTSISAIAEVRVFPLKHGDADKLATIINSIFEDPSSSGQQTDRRSRMAQMFMRMRGGGSRGGESSSGKSDSQARNAATRVKAVGDQQSNCLVVSAPTELIETIAGLVEQVDVPLSDTAQLRIFPLRYAEAEDVADSLNELFDEDAGGSSQSGQSGRPSFFSRSGMRGSSSSSRGGSSQGRSGNSRSLAESELRAVADVRTNSVVVSASEDTLLMVEKIVSGLDETPKSVPQVFIYRIEHADLEKLQELLEGMFEDLETTSTTSNLGRATPTGNVRRN